MGGDTQTGNLCTNINELYLDIWLFTNSHPCQFIEIVHKIINWYFVCYIIQMDNKNVGGGGGGSTKIPLPPPPRHALPSVCSASFIHL